MHAFFLHLSISKTFNIQRVKQILKMQHGERNILPNILARLSVLQTRVRYTSSVRSRPGSRERL